MDSVHSMLGLPLFSNGDTQITVGLLLAVTTVCIVTLLLAYLARKAVQRLVLKQHEQDIYSVRAYGSIVQFIVWVIGLELVLHLLGIHLTTLFAASGFVALAAGFAAKNIVENFMSGSILRIENAIRPGDLIVVNDNWLLVQHIGLRTVNATNFDGEEIMIPNSLVAQSIIRNLTRHDRLHRIGVQIGVAYESDLKLVRKTLEEAVEKLEWRSAGKNPLISLSEFGDSSVNYSIRVWIDDANGASSRKSDLNEAIWWALKSAGITMAYPQLDVHLDHSSVDLKRSSDEERQ